MFSTFPIPQRSFSFSFSQSLVLSCVVKLSVLTTPVQSQFMGKKKGYYFGTNKHPESRFSVPSILLKAGDRSTKRNRVNTATDDRALRIVQAKI